MNFDTESCVILYKYGFGDCRSNFQSWFSISEHQQRTNDIRKTICNVFLYLDRHNNHHHHHLYLSPHLQSHHASGLYMVVASFFPSTAAIWCARNMIFSATTCISATFLLPCSTLAFYHIDKFRLACIISCSDWNSKTDLAIPLKS